MPQMELPRHLDHQPVFALPYFDHDPGREGDTDCQFLSVGWAQWDQHQISAKVLRYTDTRWSRQSEEIPPARLVDLTTFLLLCLQNAKENLINIPPDFFDGQPEQQTIDRAEFTPSKRDAFSKALVDDEALRHRLSKLAYVLEELRQTGYFE